MPIRPLEKKKKENHAFVPKLIFLVLLIAVGFVVDKVAPWKHMSRKANSNVLGVEENAKPIHSVQQDIQSLADNLGKTAGSISDTTIGGAMQFVSNVASESSQAVSNLVFDSTVGNVVKQIDKLPPQEQQRLKEQICK